MNAKLNPHVAAKDLQEDLAGMRTVLWPRAAQTSVIQMDHQKVTINVISSLTSKSST